MAARSRYPETPRVAFITHAIQASPTDRKSRASRPQSLNSLKKDGGPQTASTTLNHRTDDVLPHPIYHPSYHFRLSRLLHCFHRVLLETSCVEAWGGDAYCARSCRQYASRTHWEGTSRILSYTPECSWTRPSVGESAAVLAVSSAHGCPIDNYRSIKNTQPQDTQTAVIPTQGHRFLLLEWILPRTPRNGPTQVYVSVVNLYHIHHQLRLPKNPLVLVWAVRLLISVF